MRRGFAVALVLFVATSPAHAGPGPQVTDTKGDWAVGSQDIVSARVSSVLVHGTPALRGELALATAPDQGVLSTYAFALDAGCTTYTFGYAPVDFVQPPQATFQRSTCTTRNPGSVTSYPVSFAITGTTLVWQVPYVGGIRRGLRVRGFRAFAHGPVTSMVNLYEITGRYDGDLASSQASYVVGSDLPRR